MGVSGVKKAREKKENIRKGCATVQAQRAQSKGCWIEKMWQCDQVRARATS